MNSAIQIKHDGASGGVLLVPGSGRFLPFAFMAVSVAVVLVLAGAAGPSALKLFIFLVVGSIGAIAIRVLFRPLRERGEILVRLSSQRAAGDSDARDAAQSEADAGRYQLARGLYYLATLTVTETAFRKGGLTLSDGIFLTALVALIFDRAHASKAPPVPRLLLLGVGLLIAGGLISSLTAVEPDMSYLEVLKNLYTVCIWFWLGTLTLRTVGQVRTAVYCWLLSSAVSGAAGIHQILMGVGAVLGSVAGTRAFGFTEHMNELGMVEAVALLPALLALIDSHGWIRRAFAMLVVALIAAGLVLSVSLSAFFGLVAASAVWVFGFISPAIIKRPAVAVSLLVIVAGIALVLRFQSIHNIPTLIDRVQNVQEKSGNTYTVGTRIETYEAALRGIGENPFVGVGLDEKSAAATEGRLVHNMLLLQWYEGGVLSFLGLLIIFATIGAIGWRTAREAVSYPEFRICIALLFSFIAFVVNSMASPEAHHRDAWMFAALLVAMEAVRRRRTWFVNPSPG